ncbi:biotin/lipoyl-binding protein [Scatolibacter rhodanostii]|uniref:biotin/lipoyl-binding protein n=1 Tax=Scatolibacter rhodanostii TaxID=2014781 RepID=UPI000C082830|nr:biotin/lipoyl-binding protein [Scatolibacter rhodanostii]
MKANKIRKRLIISLIVLTIIAVLIFTISYFVKKQQDKTSVEVIPVSNIYTENWNDQVYSSGQASSDYIQELYPDSEKVISEIFVQEGQTVKIGDPILQYDKTLLELDLQKKELELQAIDEDIRIAQNALIKLNNTTPYVPPLVTPEPQPTPEPTPTPIPPATATLYSELTADSIPYAGSGTAEDPYLYLCTPDCTLSESFLRKAFNVQIKEDETPLPATTSVPTTAPAADDTGSESPSEGSESSLPEEEPTPTPTETPKPQNSAFVAVLEVREENSNFGKLLQSFKINGFSFSSSFSLSGLYSEQPSDEIALPEFLDGGTSLNDLPQGGISDTVEMQYTAEELKQAISQKEAEIKTLILSRKQLQLNSQKAALLVDNATVTATIDGVVRSLISIDDAKANSTPFLVVSGENTFYLHGTINESLLGNIHVGDTVTVNSWEAGAYEAQIVSIGSYPITNEYGYSGGSTNPNSSTYEFTAIFTNTEGIYNGMYFDITINAPAESNDSGSFYIDKMYVRDDDSGSYVMKKGDDNRLVKQPVQTGKTMSGGYYIEIKSGLTVDDSIAFPYGKDLREGMRTRPQGTDEDYQEEPTTDSTAPSDDITAPDEVLEDSPEENAVSENEAEPRIDAEAEKQDDAVTAANPLSVHSYTARKVVTS